VELSQDVAIPLRNLTALGAGRMAGGVNAKAGQFPFVALLTVSEGGNRYSECTATLISSTVLLTAGARSRAARRSAAAPSAAAPPLTPARLHVPRSPLREGRQERNGADRYVRPG
jgi:hypothetical protein